MKFHFLSFHLIPESPHFFPLCHRRKSESLALLVKNLAILSELQQRQVLWHKIGTKSD
jgi:hypothetical protein